LANRCLAHAQICYAGGGQPAAVVYDPALPACGGPIGDVGIHCIDALRFVLGSRVAAVELRWRAPMAGRPPWRPYAAIGLDFTGSAVGTVTVSTRGAYARRSK